MAGKFSVEAVFSGKDGLSRVIDRMTRSAHMSLGGFGSAVARFDRSFARIGQSFNDKFGSAIQYAGIGTAAVTAIAGAGMLDLIRSGAQFEDTMVRAGQKFGTDIRKGTQQFEELRLAAERAGATTEFSAQQAAGALKAFGSGGFNPAQAITALPALVDFATVAEIPDLEQGADVLTKTLGSLNLKVDDATQLGKNFLRASDVMARASDKTSANVLGMYQSILEAGPVATMAGANIETLGALLGGLADSGIQDSVAGTTLKNFFLSLANPVGEAATALQQFGIKTRDANGNVVDSILVLKQLKEATKGLGTAEKATALESIFGKIPIAGVTTLLDSVDKVAALREDLYGAAGSTAKQAGIIRIDSPQMKIDELTSAWDGLKTSIFGVIGEPVGNALKSMTDSIGAVTPQVLGFFRDAIPFVKTFVGALGDGFRAAWPAIKGALGILFDGFGSKATWLGSVKEFGLLLGKITAGVVGFAAVLGGMVAAGFQLATGAVNLLLAAWNGMIAGIGNAILWFDDFGARARVAWDALVAGAKDAAKNLVDGLVSGIKGGARWVVEAISNLGTGAMDALKSLLGISSPSKVFQGYGGNVVDGFVRGLKPLSSTLQDAMPELPRLPGPTFGPIDTDPLGVLDRIRLLPAQGALFADQLPVPRLHDLGMTSQLSRFDLANAGQGRQEAAAPESKAAPPQAASGSSSDARVVELLEQVARNTAERVEVNVNAPRESVEVKRPPAQPRSRKVKVTPTGVNR